MLKYKVKQVGNSEAWAVVGNTNLHFGKTIGTKQYAEKQALIMNARYYQSMIDSIELDLLKDHGISYDEFLDYMA